jgi:hypothetical protein
MFRLTSDHHQGDKLYLAENYSATIFVFLGYWLCGSLPHGQLCLVTDLCTIKYRYSTTGWFSSKLKHVGVIFM